MKNKKTADPMRTRTGKVRLKPLNLAQLQELLSRSNKKDKGKVLNRIRELESRVKSTVPSVVE